MMPGQPQLSLWRARIAARLILVEALVCLLLARLALAVFTFQRLTWYFNLKARQPELAGAERLEARQSVRQALTLVRRRYMPQATCFHRAIAAQTMLRRRGVGTTLYYGAVSLPKSGLVAHTWVQDGAEGVIGYKTAQQEGYKTLARYPNAGS